MERRRGLAPGRWVAALLVVVPVTLLSLGCRPGDDPLTTTSRAAPVPPAGPASLRAGGVVPAVALGSTIRLPGRVLHPGLGTPVAFAAVQGGFLLTDQRGTVHAVTLDGSSTVVERTGPGGARALLVSPAGDRAAWAMPVGAGRYRVTTYDVAHDVTGHRTVLPGRDRLLARLDGRRLVLRGGRPRLDNGPLFSPDGQHRVVVRDGEPVVVDAAGEPVEPAMPHGASHPTWLDEQTVSVEVETASLISPPDGRVFRLEVCRLGEECRSVITTLTGSNLADPGVHVRAEAP